MLFSSCVGADLFETEKFAAADVRGSKIIANILTKKIKIRHESFK